MLKLWHDAPPHGRPNSACSLLGSIAALALLFAASAWAQPATPPKESVNRPGGTTQIAPTPGPATSPALPSPALPQAAVENREKAQAAKAERKAAKKAKKAKKKASKGTATTRGSSTPPSKTPAASTTPAK